MSNNLTESLEVSSVDAKEQKTIISENNLTESLEVSSVDAKEQKTIISENNFFPPSARAPPTWGDNLTTTFKMTFDLKHQDFLESVYGSLSNPVQYKDDIGFDLFFPEDIFVEPFETKFINLGIRCEYQCSNGSYLGYQIYPRSSISKTKLRLANSVGIIDPNYRGYLIVAVDNISNKTEIIKKGDRLFQLIFIQLSKPTNLVIIPNNQLSLTDRGFSGFGSTGK